MSDQDGFDARLAARFEQEHRHVPADAFVATTMRKVRAGRRRREVIHAGLRCRGTCRGCPGVTVADRGRRVPERSAGILSQLAMGQPGAWVLGALAVLVVLATRVRSR